MQVADAESRFSNLLLRLAPLRSLQPDVLEELFFAGLIGNVQIDSVVPYILKMETSEYQAQFGGKWMNDLSWRFVVDHQCVAIYVLLFLLIAGENKEESNSEDKEDERSSSKSESSPAPMDTSGSAEADKTRAESESA